MEKFESVEKVEVTWPIMAHKTSDTEIIKVRKKFKELKVI